MKQLTAQDWLDLAARRPLTAAETARLETWRRTHPEALPTLADERALTALLQHLPPAPVPSNFTALVLRAAQRATPGSPPARSRRPWWPAIRLGWPIATAIAALGLVMVIQQRQQTRARFELAQSVANLPLEALAETDLWQNYEQIRILPTEPLPAVAELDAAMGHPEP